MSDIFNINVDFKGIERVINNSLDQETFDRAQQFFSQEVMRYSDDYVPFETGVLKNGAYVDKDGIVYTAPYARYHWFGKLMVDPITGKGCFYDPITGRMWSRPNTPKVLTDRDLQYKGAPKRGGKWVERMWAEKSMEIISELQDFIIKELQK